MPSAARRPSFAAASTVGPDLNPFLLEEGGGDEAPRGARLRWVAGMLRCFCSARRVHAFSRRAGPGTGKTTVALRMGQILQVNGSWRVWSTDPLLKWPRAIAAQPLPYPRG